MYSARRTIWTARTACETVRSRHLPGLQGRSKAILSRSKAHEDTSGMVVDGHPFLYFGRGLRLGRGGVAITVKHNVYSLGGGHGMYRFANWLIRLNLQIPPTNIIPTDPNERTISETPPPRSSYTMDSATTGNTLQPPNSEGGLSTRLRKKVSGYLSRIRSKAEDEKAQSASSEVPAPATPSTTEIDDDTMRCDSPILGPTNAYSPEASTKATFDSGIGIALSPTNTTSQKTYPTADTPRKDDLDDWFEMIEAELTEEDDGDRPSTGSSMATITPRRYMASLRPPNFSRSNISVPRPLAVRSPQAHGRHSEQGPGSERWDAPSITEPSTGSQSPTLQGCWPEPPGKRPLSKVPSDLQLVAAAMWRDPEFSPSSSSNQSRSPSRR